MLRRALEQLAPLERRCIARSFVEAPKSQSHGVVPAACGLLPPSKDAAWTQAKIDRYVASTSSPVWLQDMTWKTPKPGAAPKCTKTRGICLFWLWTCAQRLAASPRPSVRDQRLRISNHSNREDERSGAGFREFRRQAAAELAGREGRRQLPSRE